MTVREYWSIFESMLQGARDHNVLRKESTADVLIPAERLEFLHSATACVYIQTQRRGPTSAQEAPPPGSSSPPGRAPATPTPELKEGDTHGEYVYHLCAHCNRLKPYKKWWPGAMCWDCYKEVNPR